MRISRLAPALLIGACASSSSSPPPASSGSNGSTPPPAPAKTYGDLGRGDFNLRAQELFLPIFWSADLDNDKQIDPNELATLWGRVIKADEYVSGGKFTPAFDAAYDKAVKLTQEGHKFEGPDAERRKVVLEELDQGWPTLVEFALSKDATAEDRAIVENVLAAAQLVEKIYAKQVGADQVEGDVPADDTISQAVFHRNQGPWCEAPKTEQNETCYAGKTKQKQVYGLYPASFQSKVGFCEELQKAKDPALADHFTVVKDEGGKLVGVPYHVAYGDEMKQIADRLDAAAGAISSEGEAALKAYLQAAARAFRDNNWLQADEAWSKMSVKNSKWYLRIGPDEVYFEPCSLKAGFHTSFARINQGSLVWQDKLDPVKDEMEAALAKLAGKPYKARKVSFHLPDFIDIILNAGDDRSAFGATIGQSLPNWGPVANEGRGRTVAMTNFYTDADSIRFANSSARSLYCEESAKFFDASKAEDGLIGTVLHEAAHNLGPAHEYKVNGKTDDQIFGGPLSSLLEELKAQTSSLYFTPWMAEKSLITPEMTDQILIRAIFWGFGHISRGMWTAEGKSKPYSQLAAIQFGHLMKQGAVVWKADQIAANGTDKGCFEVDRAKLKPAIDSLMKIVAEIKGKGDKKRAEALVMEHVGKPNQNFPIYATITERMLRSPKASFVYAVDLQ